MSVPLVLTCIGCGAGMELGYQFLAQRSLCERCALTRPCEECGEDCYAVSRHYPALCATCEFGKEEEDVGSGSGSLKWKSEEDEDAMTPCYNHLRLDDDDDDEHGLAAWMEEDDGDDDNDEHGPAAWMEEDDGDDDDEEHGLAAWMEEDDSDDDNDCVLMYEVSSDGKVNWIGLHNA